jgi:hypothetical protein
MEIKLRPLKILETHWQFEPEPPRQSCQFARYTASRVESVESIYQTLWTTSAEFKPLNVKNIIYGSPTGQSWCLFQKHSGLTRDCPKLRRRAPAPGGVFLV